MGPLRDIRLLVAAISIMLLMVACSNSTNISSDHNGQDGDNAYQEQTKDTPSGEKSISIGITVAPKNFNPIDRQDFAVALITDVLFNPLMGLDNNFQFVPMLADSIETDDNQTFLVKLNPDAVWTDGSPVTADDVLFALEMYTHPEVQSLQSSQFSILEGTEFNGVASTPGEITGAIKIDDHTIELKTKTPVSLDLFHSKVSVNLKALPKHVLEDINPSQFQQHSFFQQPTVSYGAFQFTNYVRDQYIELKANENYYRGQPKIETLYFKITAPSNLVAQLESGDIHMNFAEIGVIPAEDFDRVQNLSNVRTYFGHPVNYKVLGVNNVKYGDPRFKQALAYAINREMLVDNLLNGEGEVAHSPYSSVHPYFNENLSVKYSYDPEKAKQLLTEMGWDSSQMLDMMLPTGNKVMEQAAAIIAQNLKEVGINAQIQTADMASAVQKIRNREVDLYMWLGRFQIDPDLSQLYRSDSSLNFSGYKNATLDQIMDQGEVAVDPTERKQIYDHFQEEFARNMPQIPLFFEKQLYAVSTQVMSGEPLDLGALIDVQTWDIAQ